MLESPPLKETDSMFESAPPVSLGFDPFTAEEILELFELQERQVELFKNAN